MRGEFALIDSFLAPFRLSRKGRSAFARNSGVLAGPGDDCAQLLPSRGMKLVATTDAALDGVHFDLMRSNPEDAAWKALAMNLSDLAAAGARPRWFLCALGVPELPGRTAISLAGRFGLGMSKLAKQSGCALVGGNVTKARQWSLTITALGEARRPLTRAGARPGDALVLIGELGSAALGLLHLQAPSSKKPARSLGPAIRAQLRPEPLVDAGLIAAQFASASIDISDGLLQDLSHLCARSQVAAEIFCGALPRSKAVIREESKLAASGGFAYPLSLAGGEDYALLLAVPSAQQKRFERALAKAGIASQIIGSILERKKIRSEIPIRLLEGEREIPLPAKLGHDHLAR